MKLYRCWDSALDEDESSHGRSMQFNQRGDGPPGAAAALRVTGADAGAGAPPNDSIKGNGKGGGKKGKGKGKKPDGQGDKPNHPTPKAKTPLQIAKALAGLIYTPMWALYNSSCL